MRCHACGTQNEDGRKFCGECGAPLTAVCGECGTANPPGTKFCGECGVALAAPASAPAAGPAPALEPVAERRLVSMLFADLVGFTTMSESRDAEDVRELLSRYFDTCRTLIARYGGTVEKFIGDAVMAVWGTPVAMEDDAERAVRAALDLAQRSRRSEPRSVRPNCVPASGCSPARRRSRSARGPRGMVAGDLVNTASRIQRVAEPGTVLVGESTKRATESAIVYEDAGAHELKGKVEPVSLWRRPGDRRHRGAQRSAGLEAPFVGRDRELRLIKELFHASAGERRRISSR